MMINEFCGVYEPFRNDFPLEREIYVDVGNGETRTVRCHVPTVEHGLQMMRFQDPRPAIKVSLVRGNPKDDHHDQGAQLAKELANYLIHRGAQEVELTEEDRVNQMRELVRLKMERNDYIRNLLVVTGTVTLINGNDEGDRFWGVSPVGTHSGKNHLGIILEGLRAEYQDTLAENS